MKHSHSFLIYYINNCVALGMKTECITLTMLERKRLTCWVYHKEKHLTLMCYLERESVFTLTHGGHYANIIWRQLFAGHVVGSRQMKTKRN